MDPQSLLQSGLNCSGYYEAYIQELEKSSTELGNCKTWTLDSGLDRGLDYGLDYEPVS